MSRSMLFFSPSRALMNERQSCSILNLVESIFREGLEERSVGVSYDREYFLFRRKVVHPFFNLEAFCGVLGYGIVHDAHGLGEIPEEETVYVVEPLVEE